MGRRIEDRSQQYSAKGGHHERSQYHSELRKVSKLTGQDIVHRAELSQVFIRQMMRSPQNGKA